MISQKNLPAQLAPYSNLSTCVVASAIETFRVRLPNVGFTDASIHCVFPDFPPMVGYAVTTRLRSAMPPMEGGGYYDHTDWWTDIEKIPAPRVVVLSDDDKTPGVGAFMGEVHANILAALGCVGLVTNGAVRDVPAVREAGFHVFAGNVSVSHAYAHVFDFGVAVKVGNMEVRPGDIIHADQHGAQTVPRAIAEKVPAVAQEILQTRAEVVELCRSSEFSISKLRTVVRAAESRFHK